MPQAAWCAACQKYVWVTPQGQCQNGHTMEFLSAYYESEPLGDASTPRTPVVAQAPVAPPLPELSASPPSIGSTHHMALRSLAFLIDLFAAWTLSFVLGAGLSVLWLIVTRTRVFPAGFRTALSFIGLATFLGYFIISEGLTSTTLGKRVFGLRVVSARTSRRISWSQSWKRGGGLIVDTLFLGTVGLAVAASSPWRQRFGDRMAGTLVARSAEALASPDASEPVLASVGDVAASGPESEGPVVAPPAAATATRQEHQKVSAWVMVPLIVVALLFALAVGWGAWVAWGPARGAGSIAGSGSSTPAPVDVANTVAPVEPDSASPDSLHVKRTTNPNVPAPVLDAYIARQYPGFRVEKRVSFPSQWHAGQLGVNYLLVNKRESRFRLLVNVAELAPGADPTLDDHFDWSVGNVLTDEMMFSVDARKNHWFLSQKVQNRVIDAIVARKPSADAFVYDVFFDTGTEAEFSVQTGPKSIERAMGDSEGVAAHYTGVVSITNLENPKVAVSIQTN